MRLLYTGLLLAVVRSAAAGDEHLQLSQLIEETRQNNPALRAAQKRVEAARQKPAQERALPDPVLSVGYSSNGSPLPLAGLGTEPTSNVGFMVTQEFPYPGKRGLQAAMASKEADAELQDYLSLERQTISRLKLAFHRLYHAQRATEVLTGSRQVLTPLLEATRIRYSTGKGMQQDVLRTQTQLAILETRVLKMRQDAGMAAAEIAAIVNRPVSSPVPQLHHPASKPLESTLDDLIRAAESTAPSLKKEQKVIERNQLAVSLARKNFYPDFEVSGGYYNMGRMPDMYQFQVGIKVPIYRSRQRAALAEQVHSLNRSRRDYEAADREIRFRVEELYLQAQTAWRLTQLYQDTVIPQSGLTVDSSLPAFETGTGDFTSVLMNVMTAVEQKERYHEEMLNYFSAVIRIEELTGLELL